MKTVYLGADHAGYKLKEQLKRVLSKEYRIVDLGASSIKSDDDYPDYAFRVAKRVVKHNAIGILICGSSEGVCIAANKVKGVRAISAWAQKTAKLAREHNDANVLCLSGWDLAADKAQKIISTFLSTDFSNEPRHARRVSKIVRFEQ